MNINDMAGSLLASSEDVRHLGWTGADRIVWTIRAVAADGTARGLLQLLFGAGMVILTDRLAATLGEGRALRRYYRRNLALLVLGLIHLFVLLWPGDILHTYALAAMVVVPFRHAKPRLLLFLGLSLALWEAGTGGYAIYAQAAQHDAVVAATSQQRAGIAPTPGERRTLDDEARTATARRTSAERLETWIAAEDADRTSDIAGWAGAAWKAIGAMQGKGLELVFVWEAAAAMAIGAALYRWGVIQGARSRRFYVGLALGGYAVGLPLRLLSAVEVMRFDGQPDIGWATYEIARLATTAGHLGLIYLLLSTFAGARMLRPFAAAGRTALTIYILQTLIGSWLLYPPFGLALYGRQGWASLMLAAAAIDAVLLVVALWWTRRFAIAPVEWAWRSLAEGRRLPFRRAA